MTIRLRPHHLLCVLTYMGRGYSPAFTANYDIVVKRLGMGEDIRVVAGPDDICAPLLDGLAPHCLNDSVIERDRLAAHDVGELLSQPIHVGARLSIGAAGLASMRDAFSSGRTRQACQGCEWSTLCSAIAGDGFRDGYLQPHC